MIITDVHTHDHLRQGAIINYDFSTPMNDGLLYSAGIHPWDTDSPLTGERIDEIQRLAERRNIIAIGECGLDKIKGGTPIDIQTDILKLQIAISERFKMPVILHVVKAYPEIIALKKKLLPSAPWIIHGFRGKPQLALELLHHGFYLSLGEHHNRQSAEVIPADRLLAESDESPKAATDISSGFPHFDRTLADRLFTTAT